MTMATPFAQQMRLIVDALAPHLKRAGFRKRRHVFNREVEPGLVHVISFEMGRFDPPGTVEIPGLRESYYGEFTIEWGVFIAEVSAALQGRVNVHFAYPYDCEIRTAAGNLTLGQREMRLSEEAIPTLGTYWFNLKADAAGVAAAAERLLIDETFPFLQKLTSRQALVDSWLRGDLACCSSREGIAAAIILDGMGEHAAARRLAADYLREAAVSHPGHYEFVLERARAIGLA